ncbi:hypothetical protein LSH36_845g02013 [Paralvinella palmiformis]|uniref:Uncharacterized protein n=1 Tax=Paralvinella palmiformis TaxID=53620 RepID=A0AAD9MS44_9ANNE|nr:hypothetical protein LSH36_845g02013 [Paralvinella palmiformis]
MELVNVVRFSQASVVCFAVIVTSLFSQYPCTVIELKSNAITSSRRGLSTSHVVDSRPRRSLFPSDMKRQLVDKHNEAAPP